MASFKPRLPETLPEFPAVDTPSEFEALAILDAAAAAPPAEGEDSGVQPIAQAWKEVHDKMQRAFAANDHERALTLAERYLQHDPDDFLARMCLEECRLSVEAQLMEQLVPLDRVVVARLRLAELAEAHVDARGAFLYSRIDGMTTLEDLLDIAGMPRVDALRHIADWVARRYVTLR